jgi:ubiquitin-activating enzyme E1
MELDENLHSRQLAVYGREVMKRITTASVLVSGANGLGAEIAKNVILAGVKSLTIHDQRAVKLRDLSSQFYLNEVDVGKNRAEACRDKLQELNTAVNVRASAVDIEPSFLEEFQVMVLADASLDEAKRMNVACRDLGIKFIWAQTRGVFASVFNDFGPEFTVFDVDGEEPHTAIVASISGSNPAVVTCVEDERLQFEEGELVMFNEVEGMSELNTRKPIKVMNVKPHSFELDLDTSSSKPHTRGGIVTQFKEPKSITFTPLEIAVTDPGQFLLLDFAKFDRAPVIHVGMLALHAFEAEKGHSPRPADTEDANHLIHLAKDINSSLPEAVRAGDISEGVLRTISHCASGDLNPMAAMFGGIVGQEVVKAVSGKFHPLQQWLHFDSMEALPDWGTLGAEEFAPLGSRYDAQIAVVGRSMQQKLAGMNLLLVGAGALGCELLKNFAMMGVSSGANDQGLLTVTDDDTIEKSNLSRQFLFRDGDIGSSKSKVAADATRRINPGIHIDALQNRVSPETEAVFNDKFWQSQNLVVNALDNVNARLYVDSRCVYFCKALLESGTLGAKCNTQVVVPKLTENYGASRDPPEKSAPMCTVHSFPTTSTTA